MNELHLFAGAGGGILGGMLLGHTCVCAVEIEPYCRKVLLQRQRDGILPQFPIWDDVRTFYGKPWRGLVDVVCGGFPCTDISCLQQDPKGIDGEFSGLWKEQRRVVCEVEPRYVFVENSPMLTSRGLGTVLGDLAKLGYNAEWGVFSAADVGARHERSRMWIIAHADHDRPQGRWKGREKRQGWAWTEQQFARLVESEIQLSIPAGKDKRRSDGLANRMDRLKAVGNGQVPSVVRLAWQTLMA